MTPLRRWWTAGILTGLLVLVLTPLVHARVANTPQSPLHVGRIWMNPDYDPAEGWSGSVCQMPGGIAQPGQGSSEGNELFRAWVGQARKGGAYLMVTDWTSPGAVMYDYAGSCFFRSMDYTFPTEYLENGAFNYLYPVGVQEYYRWERPTIQVTARTAADVDTLVSVKFFPGEEGLPVELPDHGGTGARPDPIWNYTLVTECMIQTTWRHIPGVELVRKLYAYPYGSPHQDYIAMDIVLTNNGKSFSSDVYTGSDPVGLTLTDQTITGMLWAQAFDYQINAGGSELKASQNGKDTEGMYIEPWGVGNHAAVWLSDLDDETEAGNAGPDWGDPAESEWYDGLLLNSDVLIGPVFASAGAGSNYDVDDPGQPAYRVIWHERALDYESGPYPEDPEDQRGFLVDGSIQLAIGESYRENLVTADIADENPGPTAVVGYGPLGGELDPDNIDLHGWTLGWEESVHLVQIMAGGALDQEEGRRIGQEWNSHIAAEDAPADWMSAADIALVQTAKDTALKAAALAWWNYYGDFADNVLPADLEAWGIGDMLAKPTEYNQPYNVPEAPRPPGAIYVTPDDRNPAGSAIEILWTREAESAADFDTKVRDFAGYRVWRQQNSRVDPWELIAEGPAGDFYAVGARVVGENDLPAGLVYYDTDVTTAKVYWYAVTAYDDGTQNWARPGKSLESSRWWTWTGYWYVGVTAPEPTAVRGDVVRPGRAALA